MDIAQRVKYMVIFSALLGAGYAIPAAAETTNCTNITSVPAVITSQGVYCLKQHVSNNLASGAAITVSTNNVTIDCNEFKIGNLAAGPTTSAIGISADSRQNVTVRNCGVRGFRTGVQLLNGLYRVENNDLDNNTQTSIFVSGDGSSIRLNEVVATGDSSIDGLTDFYGIQASGDIDIIDNNITGVIATGGGNGNVYGIRSEDMDAGLIRGNRVRNLVAAGNGSTRGIWNQNGSHNVVENNTVILNTALVSLRGDAGIRCGDSLLLNGASYGNIVLGTGLLSTVLGLVNCTSVLAGNYVNPL